MIIQPISRCIPVRNNVWYGHIRAASLRLPSPATPRRHRHTDGGNSSSSPPGRVPRNRSPRSQSPTRIPQATTPAKRWKQVSWLLPARCAQETESEGKHLRGILPGGEELLLSPSAHRCRADVDGDGGARLMSWMASWRGGCEGFLGQVIDLKHSHRVITGTSGGLESCFVGGT